MADQYANIPELFRNFRRWCLYRLEPGQNGLTTKVPYTAGGTKASSNDRQTWSSYRLVAKALAEGDFEGKPFAGLGMFRADDIGFLDLDGILDGNGGFRAFPWDGPQPEELIRLLEPFAYIETSISGTGVHAIYRDLKLPRDSFQLDFGDHTGLANYTQSRFFTMSGDLWTLGDLSRDASAVFDKLLPEMFAARERWRTKRSAERRLAAPGVAPDVPLAEFTLVAPDAEAQARSAEAHEPAVIDADFVAIESAAETAPVVAKPEPAAPMAAQGRAANVITMLPLSDGDVLSKCREDDLFRAVENGDYSSLEDQSLSGADLALCQRLAFYTGRDAAQIDRCFRQTAHFSVNKRETKWDSSRPGGTYGSQTISFAISITTEVYKPRARQKRAAATGTNGSPALPGVAPAAREAHAAPADAPPPERDPFDPHPLTDMGNAQRLIAMFGENIRWSEGEKLWRHYADGVWLPDPSGTRIGGLAIKVAEQMAANKHLRKWGLKSQSGTALKQMATLAAHIPGVMVPSTKFDGHPYRLNVANGAIDLRTGQIQQAVYGDFFGHRLSTPYRPDARSEVWDRFLESVMPDPVTREYLQRAAGYTLTGSVREECCFFLTGSGRNGKGAFLLTLQTLLETLAGTANIYTFLVSRRDNTVDIAAMRGKRMIIAQEASRHSHFNESVLKTLTGGDRVSAKMLYQNPIEFLPSGKIWFASNSLPEVDDDSPGFWSRLRVIVFPRSFAGEEDLGLKERLLDPACLSAVLAWAVEGAIRWNEDGLPTPPAIVEATDTYREESDPIAQFIGERCDREPDRQAHAREIYQAYDLWARAVNLKPCSMNAFGRRLTQLGYARKFRDGYIVYRGISLNDRLYPTHAE